MAKRRRRIPYLQQGGKIYRTTLTVEVDAEGHYSLTPDQVEYLKKLREPHIGMGNVVKPGKGLRVMSGASGEAPSRSGDPGDPLLRFSPRVGAGALP